jgi:hypothetical protein
MSIRLCVALVGLLCIGNGPAARSEVPDYCKTLPRSVEGLPQLKGKALRSLVVGSVMEALHSNSSHPSSSQFAKDGKYFLFSGANEVYGTYKIENNTISIRTGPRRLSIRLYKRGKGLIVARAIFHYNQDEVRITCITLKRVSRAASS